MLSKHNLGEGVIRGWLVEAWPPGPISCADPLSAREPGGPD